MALTEILKASAFWRVYRQTETFSGSSSSSALARSNPQHASVFNAAALRLPRRILYSKIRRWPLPHIPLEPGVPGIRGPMVFRPETARPLRQLAEVLLRSAHTLTPGERALIATYVSALNDCHYCQTVHAYTAATYLDGDEVLVDMIKRDPDRAEISDKLKSLLAIAAKVQQSGKLITLEDIKRARTLGATDLEIHDTVLIAAAFCMYNRYVDGLDVWDPEKDQIYRDVANRVVSVGYTQPG